MNIAVSNAFPPATSKFDYALVWDMHTKLDIFSNYLLLKPIYAWSNNSTLLVTDLMRKRIAYYGSPRGDRTIYVASEKALL